MSLLGIHIGDIKQIKNIKNKRIKFIQIFVSSVNYFGPAYKNIMLNIKNIKLVVHSSYTINLSSEWDNRSWWIQQFITEIEKAEQLNAFAIVIHTGKQLNNSISQAINNMYSALLYVHKQTIGYEKVKILIETPAGQGTEILTDITEYCNFMNKFYTHTDISVQKRFGICLDTCHIFASGYDLHSNIFDTIHNIVGIDKIKLCHINDSKEKINSKLDRHANIGDGYIGKKKIINIVKFLNKLEIPMILETPEKKIYEDYELLQNL